MTEFFQSDKNCKIVCRDMKNPLQQPLRVKTLVFCPFDCPLQLVEETTGDIAKIEDLSGPVQISTGSGFAGQASRNKQSESLAEKQEVPIQEKGFTSDFSQMWLCCTACLVSRCCASMCNVEKPAMLTLFIKKGVHPQPCPGSLLSLLFPPPLPPVRHAGSGMTQGGPNTRHLSKKKGGRKHHSKERRQSSTTRKGEWKAAPLLPHQTKEGWKRSTAQEEEADHHFTSPFFTLLQLRVLSPTALILIFF